MNTFFDSNETVIMAVVGLVALVVLGLDLMVWRG